MIPLFLIVHIFVGTTLAGSAMVAALTLGYDTLQPLLVAALIGFIVAFPVSWFVAKEISERTR
ncbi:MAG: CTP synthetase [Silicimonas sp.]|jgi:predicted PurR-regulated permease PerM